MKNRILAAAICAAFAAAPFTSRASDKEVQKSCACRRHQQVALFVSGRGIGQQAQPRMQSVTHAQVGQGVGVTFYAGAPAAQ
jgi:hypothetical protein